VRRDLAAEFSAHVSLNFATNERPVWNPDAHRAFQRVREDSELRISARGIAVSDGAR